MKLNKFFMLAMAGLTMTACSNDDEMGTQLPKGVGAVSVRIVNPSMGRAVGVGHENAVIVKAKTDVVVALTDDNGTKTYTFKSEVWNSATDRKVKFWNVVNPKSITVTMNGGAVSYNAENLVDADNLQEVENVPVYGEVSESEITLTSQVETPNGDHSVGAEAGDKDKTYQMYTATVKLAIPVARLEVGGIKHVVHTGEGDDNCKYQTLSIAGVYLDNVVPNGDGVKYQDGVFTNASGTAVDYSFDGEHGTGVEAILKDAINEENKNFLTLGAQWPTVEGEVFGYNFFGCEAAKMPKFKIYFSESVSANPDSPLPSPRYAMITNYKNADGTQDLDKFEPGKIYRITGAFLDDKNIIGDENGNTTYGVTVTVEEAQWDPVNITAEWQE